ncbi:hypothetical protein LEN26_019581 [Aphanomyces euteiches]|nr:hypothetical protein LEN26_019581 [Aphanomyces euteiches]KAH9114724.1 hypothetical protein AeMF1_011186 [Aphanomyces euteiches]KAH9195250.1 hypothetical protein AeNC1_002791 [Aphanomyces euteiches]
MLVHLVSVFVALGASLVDGRTSIGNASQTLNRFAFGSCNDQSKPQMLWPVITARDPQLWLWLGDNIYGDIRKLDKDTLTNGVFRPAPPEVLKEKYELQLSHPDYKVFRERFPIIGIWDDHDYGINDGDKNYLYKKESQQLFLDFLDEPRDSPRRQQEGIYTSYEYGQGDQRVKFILLDNRYHRDPYSTPGGDFLGEAQWKWLENELMTTTATFNVIASGIEILPNDRWYKIGETWSKFPASRTRLLNLIQTSRASGVILLSGDVHYAEIHQVNCGSKYALTEITTSGMTHSWKLFNLASRIGIIPSIGFTLANMILPWQYRVRPDEYYGGFNFADMHFDWKASPPTAHVSVLGRDGRTKLQQVIPATRFEGDAPETCDSIHELDPTEYLIRKVAVVVVLGSLLISVLVNMVVVVVLPLQLLWLLVAGSSGSKAKVKTP